jgi:vacuolar-type H+-ATPase subunit F/Vma7
MFDEKIEELMELRADMLIKKHEFRESYGNSIVKLTVLMARHIDKSTSSFENKIPLLLKIPDIKEEVEKLNESFVMDEIYFKNYRDFADLYRDKVIELQSKRKNSSMGL